VGVRVSWLMAAEAFLFAAYAAVLTVPVTALSAFKPAALRLYDALPWVGIVLAALVFIAVCAAILRLKELREEFKHSVRNVQGYPKITSKRVHRWTGRIPGMLAPLVVILAWCLVKW
jgi:hypothetical protein